MTQASLFTLPPAPDTLPHQGLTPEARHAGAEAARHAAERRPALAQRYLALLLARGVHGATDHEASQALRAPVSSICSTRSGHTVAPQICPHGHRKGPYGEANTVYVLKVAVGRRFDQEAV